MISEGVKAKISGKVRASLQENSPALTREEILIPGHGGMVLVTNNGKVYILAKELMDKSDEILSRKKLHWAYAMIKKESERMLRPTHSYGEVANWQRICHLCPINTEIQPFIQ